MMYPVVLLAMVGVLVAHAQVQVPLRCGTHGIYPRDTAVVQSPNFPENYGPKKKCVWKIVCNPRESTLMRLDCPVFDLEESANCTRDKLAVKLTGKNVERYCGNTRTPNGITTTDGFVRLKFASNRKVHKQGFVCNIRCWDASATTAATTTPEIIACDRSTTTTANITSPTATTTTPSTTTATPTTTTTTPTSTTTTTTHTTTTTTPTTTTTTPTTTTTTPTTTTTTPTTTTTTPTTTTITPTTTTTTTTTTTPTTTTTTPTTTTDTTTNTIPDIPITTTEDCFLWFCWRNRMPEGE